MAVPILLMEFKGFAALATQLARDTEFVGLTPDRIRASAIEIINGVIESAKATVPCTHSMQLGGDTWYFLFDNLEEAITFGWLLLDSFFRQATENAIFFLKPSLAISIGEPKLLGERFLDDTSIATYRVADGGRSYNFYILKDAIQLSKQIAWVRLKSLPPEQFNASEVQLIDWQSTKPNLKEEKEISIVSLPSLLLDSEVAYANSPLEALTNVIRQQARAKSVLAFGGPVPYDVPAYRDYLKSTLATLKGNPDCKWTLLSYIPLNEVQYSYTWLELCRNLSVKYGHRFAFAAFTIPKGQLRPISYQVFDEMIVHIGLRSYSPHKGTPTMSSAIMFKNRQIALRFKDEFMENWRRIGALNDRTYAKICGQFRVLNNEMRRSALAITEELLAEE